MSPTEPPPTQKAGGWLEWIIGLAERIDQMATGGVVSTTGGAFVLGVILGNLAWVPFGLTLPLLLYRLHTDRIKHAERKRLWLIEAVAAAKESVARREIPETDKRFLLDQLDRELAEPARKKLSPANEKEEP